jgi:hypothetical protein
MISPRPTHLGVRECEIDNEYEYKAWYDEDEVVSPADIPSDELAPVLISD